MRVDLTSMFVFACKLKILRCRRKYEHKGCSSWGRWQSLQKTANPTLMIILIFLDLTSVPGMGCLFLRRNIHCLEERKTVVQVCQLYTVVVC